MSINKDVNLAGFHCHKNLIIVINGSTTFFIVISLFCSILSKFNLFIVSNADGIISFILQTVVFSQIITNVYSYSNEKYFLI